MFPKVKNGLLRKLLLGLCPAKQIVPHAAPSLAVACCLLLLLSPLCRRLLCSSLLSSVPLLCRLSPYRSGSADASIDFRISAFSHFPLFRVNLLLQRVFVFQFRQDPILHCCRLVCVYVKQNGWHASSAGTAWRQTASQRPASERTTHTHPFTHSHERSPPITDLDQQPWIAQSKTIFIKIGASLTISQYFN